MQPMQRARVRVRCICRDRFELRDRHLLTCLSNSLKEMLILELIMRMRIGASGETSSLQQKRRGEMQIALPLKRSAEDAFRNVEGGDVEKPRQPSGILSICADVL